MYTLRLDTNDNTLRLKTKEGEKIYRPSFEPALDLYIKLRELAENEPGSVIEELESNAELVLPDPSSVVPDNIISDEDPDTSEFDVSLETSLGGPNQTIEQWKTSLGPGATFTQVDTGGATVYTAYDSSHNIIGTFTAGEDGSSGLGVKLTTEAVDPDDDIWDSYGDSQNFSIEDIEAEELVKEALNLIPKDYR